MLEVEEAAATGNTDGKSVQVITETRQASVYSACLLVRAGLMECAQSE